MSQAQRGDFPSIEAVGLDGLLVRFSDRLGEPANRAALAFRAAIERDAPQGVEECSTSLVSTFLRFDPLAVEPDRLREALRARLSDRDWLSEPLPEGRRFVTIPTVYGTDLAPQLGEAAAAAGLEPVQAAEALGAARLRVTAIGFAPGQPYLGTLPEIWDIPRQTALTPRVPQGALVLAIRQLVLFSVSTPTGWRHVGQTAAELFRPGDAQPFLLRPGDEVRFAPAPREAYDRLRKASDGGVTVEPLA